MGRSDVARRTRLNHCRNNLQSGYSQSPAAGVGGSFPYARHHHTGRIAKIAAISYLVELQSATTSPIKNSLFGTLK